MGWTYSVGCFGASRIAADRAGLYMQFRSNPEFPMSLRIAALLIALASPALAEGHLPALLVEDARIVETTPVAKTAGGYLSITNESETAYTLTGIEAGFPAAELHESVMDGDVMRMEPREDGFDIAPGETLELSRGGKHVMFMGLTEPLKAGDSVKATLIFTDEVRVPVTFDVVSPEKADGADMDHGH